MGKKGKNKNRRVGKGTNDGNDTTPGYAFTVIDDISDSQSKLLSEQGRHVFYAMFAAAWATLWADGERMDMTGKILLILVLCIGIIYLILHLGRYYTLTKVSREILDHLLTKKYDDDKASIHMNIASDNAFTKAADTQESEVLPRMLPFAKFQEWLSRCRRHDKDMAVEMRQKPL